MNSRLLFFVFSSLISLGHCSVLSSAVSKLVNKVSARPFSEIQTDFMGLETEDEWINDWLYELRHAKLWHHMMNIKSVAPKAHGNALKSLFSLFEFSKLYNTHSATDPIVKEVTELVKLTNEALISQQNSSEIVVRIVVDFLQQTKARESDPAKKKAQDAVLTVKVNIMNELQKIFCKLLEESHSKQSLDAQSQLLPLKEMMCHRFHPKVEEEMQKVKDVDVKKLLTKIKGKSAKLDVCIDELLKDDVWNLVLSFQKKYPVEHEAAFKAIFDILDSNKHCVFKNPNHPQIPEIKQQIYRKKKILTAIKDDALMLAKIVLENIEHEYSWNEAMKVYVAGILTNKNDTDYVEMHKIFAMLLGNLYGNMNPDDKALLKTLKDNLCAAPDAATSVGKPLVAKTGLVVVVPTTGATGTTDTTANPSASEIAKKFQSVINDTKNSRSKPQSVTSNSSATTNQSQTTVTDPSQGTTVTDQSQSTSNNQSQTNQNPIQSTDSTVSNQNQSRTNESKNEPTPSSLNQQNVLESNPTTTPNKQTPPNANKPTNKPSSSQNTVTANVDGNSSTNSQPDSDAEVAEQDGNSPSNLNGKKNSIGDDELTVAESGSPEGEIKKDQDGAKNSDKTESSNTHVPIIIVAVVAVIGLTVVTVYLVVVKHRRS